MMNPYQQRNSNSIFCSLYLTDEDYNHIIHGFHGFITNPKRVLLCTNMATRQYDRWDQRHKSSSRRGSDILLVNARSFIYYGQQISGYL